MVKKHWSTNSKGRFSQKNALNVYLRSFWLKFMALKRYIVLLFNPLLHTAHVSEVIIAHDSGLD